MTTYEPASADLKFVLNEVLQVGEQKAPGFEEIDSDLINSIIDNFADFTVGVISPLNEVGDQHGAHVGEHGVVTAPGFGDAYRTYVSGGWPALTADAEHGGDGVPSVVFAIIEEMLAGANQAFAMAPMTARGAYRVINTFASDDLRARYLPKIASGEWGTAMSLTEPQCGSALGLVQTRAEPVADGSYRLYGTKVFNSWGDHDMTDNIIHLVLARLPQAPPGTKGLSLFLVPKYLVDDDGQLGSRNGFAVSSVEKKMGIHGSPTCVTNFEGATGQLVGEPHHGMRNMFVIMNAMRLASGICGIALADAAQRNAARYAKERLAGRAIGGTRYPDLPADPIIVHPDVRRMLLFSRAVVEAGRALHLWVALSLDLSERDADEARRQRLDKRAGLLTPVVKGFLCDIATDCTDQSLQCFGGHGYIRENGAEQYVRDARFLRLGEGTSGIQSLDFLGRKVVADEGAALRDYFAEVQGAIAAMDAPDLRGIAHRLTRALEVATQLTDEQLPLWTANPERMASASLNFLHLVGYLSLGHMWALLATVASSALSAEARAAEFYETKLKLARFYCSYFLSEIDSRAEKIRAGEGDLMSVPDRLI